MKMVICCSLALAQLGLLSHSAAAQTVSATNEEERIICKTAKREGSRVLRRLCATKARWEKMTEQQKRDYSEVRDRPQIEIGR